MLDRVQLKLEAREVVRSAKVSAYLFTLLALVLESAADRQKSAQKAENPHMLVLSATPIPRTLALIICCKAEGARALLRFRAV